MIVFPGKIYVELDLEIEKVGSIKIISKEKRKRNFGKVLQDSENFKKGQHVMFFSRAILLDGKAILEEKDIILILKKNGMQFKGKRLLVEADKGKEIISEKTDLVASQAHIPILPTGTILEVGDEVIGYKKGDRVIFDMQVSVLATPYQIPGYENKPLFFVMENNIIAIL